MRSSVPVRGSVGSRQRFTGQSMDRETRRYRVPVLISFHFEPGFSHNLSAVWLKVSNHAAESGWPPNPLYRGRPFFRGALSLVLRV